MNYWTRTAWLGTGHNMAVIMKVIDAYGLTVVDTTPWRGDGGAWVEDCDVDANHGIGSITLTTDASKAKRFPTLRDALEYWKRPSTLVPLRDDGKPNRPLSALSIEFQTLPD
jgi:hypothetical protein